MTFSLSLTLLTLCFHSPNFAVDQLVVAVDSGPERAQIEIILRNPFEKAVQIQELLLEIPVGASSLRPADGFLVNLRQFSRIEFESFADMDVFWLKMPGDGMWIQAGETASLKLGQFVATGEREEPFAVNLRVAASLGEWNDVPFRIGYTQSEYLAKSSEMLIHTQVERFTSLGDLRQIGPAQQVGMCKRTSFTVGVTSVQCASPALCLVGTSCQVDNSVFNVKTVTVNVPKCNCL